MSSRTRDRPLATDMPRKVMAAILAHREAAPLLPDGHFPVDGTLVQARASMESLQPKEKATSGGDDDPGHPPDTGVPAKSTSDQSAAKPEPMTCPARRNRNAEVDFRGERRPNATHASTTDPEARLFKKSPGAGAMLCLMGHCLMENRSGLVVQAGLTRADGPAERRAASDMLHRHSPGSTRRLPLAADRGYDSADVIAGLRQMVVTPMSPRRPGTPLSTQNRPAPRLRQVTAAAEEDRGTFRLGQNRRLHGADPVSRLRARACPLHLGDGGLQLGEAAETARHLSS